MTGSQARGCYYQDFDWKVKQESKVVAIRTICIQWAATLIT